MDQREVTYGYIDDTEALRELEEDLKAAAAEEADQRDQEVAE